MKHIISKTDRILSILYELVLSILLVSLPFFFLPGLTNKIELPKIGLFLLLNSLAFCLFLIKKLLRSNELLILSAGSVFFFLLSIIALIQHVTSNIHPLLSISHPFGALILLHSAIFLFHTSNTLLHPSQKRRMLLITSYTGVLLGILNIYKLIALLKPDLMSLPYDPSGNILSSFAYQTALLIILLTNKQTSFSIPIRFNTTATGILLLLGMTMHVIKPSITPQPLSFAWKTSLYALSESPVLGMGPLKYEFASNQSRSPETNLLPAGNLRFQSGPNLLFHLTTLYGFGFLLLLIFIILSTIFHTIKYLLNMNKRLYIVLVLFCLYLVLFPADFLVLTGLLWVLFTFNDVGLHIKLINRRVFFYKLSMIMSGICITIISIGFTVSIVRSDALLSLAFINTSTNNLPEAEKAIKSALFLAPYRDEPHVLSAQIILNQYLNVLIESNSDIEQKQSVLPFINQAIEQTQYALKLNPYNPVTRQFLIHLYVQLIPYITNADQWAIQTIEETIAFDPTNPLYRAQLGEVLYRTNNSIRAIQQYEQAVRLSPQEPTYLYALAKLYVLAGNQLGARELIGRILETIPPQSPEAERLRQEYQQLSNSSNSTNYSIGKEELFPSLQPKQSEPIQPEATNEPVDTPIQTPDPPEQSSAPPQTAP